MLSKYEVCAILYGCRPLGLKSAVGWSIYRVVINPGLFEAAMEDENIILRCRGILSSLPAINAVEKICRSIAMELIYTGKLRIGPHIRVYSGYPPHNWNKQDLMDPAADTDQCLPLAHCSPTALVGH